MSLGYVTLTRQQRQEAEERMEGERASCVVSGAKRDHSEFWRRVDAAREQPWTPTGRCVPFQRGRG
jgi:hypothetical protein